LRALDCYQHLVQDELRITEKGVVRETQHVEALLTQEGVPAKVVTALALVLVRRAVELDDHARRGAQEVDDIGRNRNLALELVPMKTASAHLSPEQVLGLGQHRRLLLGEGA
jgi:hypothetical protein